MDISSPAHINKLLEPGRDGKLLLDAAVGLLVENEGARLRRVYGL